MTVFEEWVFRVRRTRHPPRHPVEQVEGNPIERRTFLAQSFSWISANACLKAKDGVAALKAPAGSEIGAAKLALQLLVTPPVDVACRHFARLHCSRDAVPARAHLQGGSLSRLIRSAALFLFITHFRSALPSLQTAYWPSVEPRDAVRDFSCFVSRISPPHPLTTPLTIRFPHCFPSAFTFTTDRTVISPSTPNHTPITQCRACRSMHVSPPTRGPAVPSTPAERLERALRSRARRERAAINGDFAWSDSSCYSKTRASELIRHQLQTLGCRINPTILLRAFLRQRSRLAFTRYRIHGKAAELARDGVRAGYGRPPAFTYAVGTSNGGYQVRRAVEIAPKLFDGGVDWEGTFVDEHAPNILTDLPPAVLNFPDYIASASPPTSTAAKNIQAAGYPPAIFLGGTASLWGRYNAQFWEVTFCQCQKRLDPGYDPSESGTARTIT